MGAKYFSPILKVKIDKYKKANYLQGVADYLRRGGKRRGAKNGGRIFGAGEFYKKTFVYLSPGNRQKKIRRKFGGKNICLF